MQYCAIAFLVVVCFLLEQGKIDLQMEKYR